MFPLSVVCLPSMIIMNTTCSILNTFLAVEKFFCAVTIVRLDYLQYGEERLHVVCREVWKQTEFSVCYISDQDKGPRTEILVCYILDQEAKSETGNSVCCIFDQGEKRKTDILVNYILDQDEEPKTEFLDWYSLDEGGLDKKETIQIATFWIKMRNQKQF